ncbi:hypothetical protein QR680_010248 [Steinernema hermaphroditum]|uniref:Uncharacterized protein n=1 Tax=Steinernema hermaphroditum TaxID=289476 RepID=A0AA39MBF8_9BILA|nr:hypothetical protein QR680_010248 [Steinernema hermaphroditum]
MDRKPKLDLSKLDKKNLPRYLDDHYEITEVPDFKQLTRLYGGRWPFRMLRLPGFEAEQQKKKRAEQEKRLEEQKAKAESSAPKSKFLSHLVDPMNTSDLTPLPMLENFISPFIQYDHEDAISPRGMKPMTPVATSTRCDVACSPMTPAMCARYKPAIRREGMTLIAADYVAVCATIVFLSYILYITYVCC